MKTSLRRSAAWTLSILIHATLAVLIVRAGLKYAVPEGSVSTEDASTATSVEIDDAGKAQPVAPPASEPDAASAAVPAPPQEEPPAPQEESAPTEQAPPTEQKEAAAAPVAQTLPTKSTATEEQAPAVDTAADTDAGTTQEDKPNEETEDQIAQQVASEDEAPDAAPSSDDTAKTDEAAKTVVAQPSTPPASPVAEAPPQAPPPAAPAPVESSQPQSQSASPAPHGIPAFGTPGTTLNEAQLIEDGDNAKPRYPWSARMRRQEGTVIVRAYVQSDGAITRVSVHQSSGYSALDEECVRAYALWHYKPGPEGWVLKPFRFALTK